jgi:hypothetical protein
MPDRAIGMAAWLPLHGNQNVRKSTEFCTAAPRDEAAITVHLAIRAAQNPTILHDRLDPQTWMQISTRCQPTTCDINVENVQCKTQRTTGATRFLHADPSNTRPKSAMTNHFKRFAESNDVPRRS